MGRIGILVLALAGVAMAEDFKFSIASPVAAQDFAFKSAAFVFRTEGCAEPAKLQVSATAEGLVNGTRRTQEIKVVPTSRAGIYAISQSWPAPGQWVVNLNGTCGESKAGALIPIGAGGFRREASKLFPRPATDAEIEKALKEAPMGGEK